MPGELGRRAEEWANGRWRSPMSRAHHWATAREAYLAGLRAGIEMAAKEAEGVATDLDGIKYEFYASVYTVEDDQFEKVFNARDELMAIRALLDEPAKEGKA